MGEGATRANVGVPPKLADAWKDCYYPNIDKSKLEVVNAVGKKLEDADYWSNFDSTKFDNDDDEPVLLKILRFCRAGKWNVERTVAMIKNDVDWRKDNDLFFVRKQYTNSVLDADYATQVFDCTHMAPELRQARTARGLPEVWQSGLCKDTPETRCGYIIALPCL